MNRALTLFNGRKVNEKKKRFFIGFRYWAICELKNIGFALNRPARYFDNFSRLPFQSIHYKRRQTAGTIPTNGYVALLMKCFTSANKSKLSLREA